MVRRFPITMSGCNQKWPVTLWISIVIIIFGHFLRVRSHERDESPSCSDQHSCLSLELRAWMDSFNDKSLKLDCDSQLKSDGSANGDHAPKIYTFAKKCQDKDAIWQYKYTGGKGKGRIFKGRGKLMFTTLSNPPFGYDYGMKSGKCLVMSEHFLDKLSALEGNFEDGIIDGDADLTFFDGTAAKATFKKGVIHGLMRTYAPIIDKETNIETAMTRITSLEAYINGEPTAYSWTFKEDEVSLLISNDKTKDSWAMVPMANTTRHVTGQLDDDEMLHKAQETKIMTLKDENCLKIPQYERFGDTFDYDLQIKAQVRATSAKLLRFFEAVADEKLSLIQNFQPLTDPVDPENSIQLFEIIKKERTANLYTVHTGDGEVQAQIDVSQDSNGFQGFVTILIMSKLRRSDLYAMVQNETDNDPDQVKATEKWASELVPLEHLPHKKYLPKQIQCFKGKLVNSKFQGEVKIYYTDGSVIEGMAKDNVLHGLSREFAPPFYKGRRKRFVSRFVENVVISATLMGKDDPIAEVVFVGNYKNGYLDGPGWKFLVGGSFLFGNFSKTSTFTTNQGAFINQDLETCYVGQFEDGKMMAGQVAKVIGYSSVGDFKVPKISEPSGTIYRYVQGKNDEIIDPLVPDSTEENWVYVAPSTLGPEVGEGLFARKEIPTGTVVAYFGGLKYNFTYWNQTGLIDPEYWQWLTETREILHLPDEYGRDTKKYKATLGHKINHSFSKWNCMFHDIDHPRFGLIPAARTTETVGKDQELLCLYEMKYEEASPWYQELWRKEIDSDFIYGPFGHRGAKKEVNQTISPLLSNGTFYKEFYKHAVNNLNLEPLT